MAVCNEWLLVKNVFMCFSSIVVTLSVSFDNGQKSVLTFLTVFLPFGNMAVARIVPVNQVYCDSQSYRIRRAT